MRQFTRHVRRVALIVGASVVLLGAACTGDEEPESGTAKGEVRAEVSAAVVSEPSPASGPAAAAAKPAVDANGAITIVTKDNVFEPKAFSGKANTKVTLTLDNRGSAVHDFRIKDQRGPDGEEYQSALIPGGQSGTLTFTLPAGTYDFYCFVHPVEMRGKITME